MAAAEKPEANAGDRQRKDPNEGSKDGVIDHFSILLSARVATTVPEPAHRPLSVVQMRGSCSVARRELDPRFSRRLPPAGPSSRGPPARPVHALRSGGVGALLV